MENQILIPEGWTYFAHRTNTARWDHNPFNDNSIKLKKLMSAVTERDVYQEVEHYGKAAKKAYSIGNGEPFEIRCLICNLPYLRTLDSNDIKQIMNDEFYFDIRNFGGCRGQRHPSIPNGEELVVIGHSEYDEVSNSNSKIIWTIPKRFMDFYKQELNKGNNRKIDLKIEENNKHL
jgi:hypothetical protein